MTKRYPQTRHSSIDVAGLLASLDILEIIAPHVTLKKKGATHVGLCPFHAEKTPSFYVNTAKQFYHCFGCGASGDAISFVQTFHRMAFVQACEQLAGGHVVRADPAQIKAAQARLADIERQALAEQQAIQAEVATKAQRLWTKARPASRDHPYLVAKRIKGYGLRQLKSMLVVPVARADGRLASLQFIQADGRKTFLTGGQTKGCYAPCGKPGAVICICEGVATRDSIFEATGYATVAAFSASNLLPVALALKAKFAEAVLVLCADNDRFTPGNPGVAHAREAALAVQGKLAIPQFEHNSHGQ